MNPIGVRKADQPKTVSKRMKPEQEEPEESEVKLNDLPELPFELILSYLSLEDRIKTRAVSRRWYNVINSFRSKSICFSDRPSGFISEENRLMIREFAQSSISSTKFQQFFQTFGQSILANLKHLLLRNLVLNAENTPASFVQILNSFGRLEKLDLFNIKPSCELARNFPLRLNLPMLKSFQLTEVGAIKKLTLDAPRLQIVKLEDCYHLEMEIVHHESIEKLAIDWLEKMGVSKMKNLKYLYCGECSRIDSTLLSNLEHLKEIHLYSETRVSGLFQQKARYGRSNLKIFFRGCLLNAPVDTAIGSSGYFDEEYMCYLAENPSKVANEILWNNFFPYWVIEAVAPGLEIDLLKRFTDLNRIVVIDPVKGVDRFLELLKNLNNIVEIDFERYGQQPELFDRLPDHCAIQHLEIEKATADLAFLFRLKSLMFLKLSFSIDIEIVSRVLEELPFLFWFKFEYLKRKFTIRTDHSKQFRVYKGAKYTKMSDVNAVVQWIREKATEDEEPEDPEDLALHLPIPHLRALRLPILQDEE